jgi:hypothetical protein
MREILGTLRLANIEDVHLRPGFGERVGNCLAMPRLPLVTMAR